jgi:hypothetical protein
LPTLEEVLPRLTEDSIPSLRRSIGDWMTPLAARPITDKHPLAIEQRIAEVRCDTCLDADDVARLKWLCCGRGPDVRSELNDGVDLGVGARRSSGMRLA